MKKIIVFLFILMSICLISSNRKETIKPYKSIRFRIIASTNEATDQALKLDIRNDLLPEIKDIEEHSSNIQEVRKSIKNNIPLMRTKLDKYPITYNINYGQNYFPEKEYLGNKYPAQNYESLVITLGDAKGDNWWCMLFPPLCLIEAEKNNLDNIQYEFFVNKVLAKYE